MRSRHFLFAAVFLALGAKTRAQVVITDIIPFAQSEETDQSSEPSIAVNPRNTQQIIVSAFGGNFNALGVPFNPYFSSQNGGQSWLNFQNVDHIDTALAWAPSGVAYMTRSNPLNTFQSALDVQQSSAPNNPPAFSVVAGSMYGSAIDQPQIKAATVNGVDRLYVGFNDNSLFGGTASVRFSTDGGTTWDNEVIDRANSPLGDLPAIRPAVSGSRVYAAFQRNDANLASGDNQADIVIVRDDNGLTGIAGNRFNSLGTQGVTIASNITVPFDGTAVGAERLGSDLSVAVSSTNPDKVYVAYAEVVNGHSVIRVYGSSDGGATWHSLYTTAPDTGLPSLSVTDNGVVGLLYQALDVNNNQATHFLQAADDFAAVTDTLLLQFPDNNPLRDFSPYVGDYFGLTSVGNDFYGSFSGSNDLNTAFSPNPITFLRAADFGGAGGAFRLLDTTGHSGVNFSIDPYFFHVAAVPEPGNITLLVGLGVLGLLSRRRTRRNQDL